MTSMEESHQIPMLSVPSDTPKASPRISSKVKSSASKESGTTSTTSSQRHSIVVVTEGGSKKRSDAELIKLEAVPVFLPLIKASLNLGSSSGVDPENLDQVDAEEVLLLCQRYQEHLKQCSEAVAFDQNALCVRIKEVCHPPWKIHSRVLHADVFIFNPWIFIPHYSVTSFPIMYSYIISPCYR